MNEFKQQKLIERIKETAVRRDGAFSLSGGAVSTYYIDGRLITFDPRGLVLSATLIIEKMIKDRICTVGGPSNGADPLVGGIVAMSHGLYGRPIDGFVVRKTRKEHGTKRIIEGVLTDPTNITLVEDVSTTGAALIRCITLLRTYGHNVVNAISIVDRLAGAKKALDEIGVELTSLCTVNDLDLE